MQQWWRQWGDAGANPFVDFSTTWIEPLIQRAVDVSLRVEPDVMSTLAYMACMGSAYLFHSPFRAHATAAMDTYGRITKVFQTWCTIVFFCFHLGPQFFQEKQGQLARVHAAEETVPILFFPLFITFTVWFGFLHKMKRRWGLGVTYGGRFSVVVLNSIVLAALGTGHYAYCYTLYTNASNRVWRYVLYSLTPATITVHPFRSVLKLLGVFAAFIAADYNYKRWHGFDPARGILWAELYELNKGLRHEVLTTEKDGKEERRDWRELVAPPRVYAAHAPSARHVAAAAHAAATSHRGPAALPSGANGDSARLRGSWRGSPDSTIGIAAAPTPALMPEVPSMRPRPVVPRMLYHECPPDVNLAVLESSSEADDAALRRIFKAGLSASTSASPTSDVRAFPSAAATAPSPMSFAGVAGSLVHTSDHSDRTLARLMSFRAPQLFVKEAQKAQHPVNRPGMVPWWSTFVLFTAWQTVAGATLRFLAFDVRTIQGFTTPKIFHLHFSPSLRETVRGAAAAFCPTPATAPPPSSSSAAAAAARGHAGGVTGTTSPGLCSLDGAARGGPLAAQLSPRGLPAPAEEATREWLTPPPPAALPAPASPTEAPDIWFDWIADVGDGFNPTYAMARLLAQPMLRVPLAASRRARQSRRKAQGAGSRDTAVAATGPVSRSAPSTPVAKPGESAGGGTVGTAANARPLQHTASGSTLHYPDTAGASAHDVAGATSRASDAAPTGPHAARAARNTADEQRLSWTPHLGASVAHRRVATGDGDGGISSDSFASTSSAPPRRTPRRRTASEEAPTAKTAARHAQLQLEKDGFVSLPRGSFVVVGGDLAYPSPDDETYTTRLFEPYHDAMSGNVRLQNLFHAEQQHVVVADAADADVAHVHLLDAATVSAMATGRAARRTGRATAEEALRSVPLLFAIPGNHDWFDGLTTFRKYILERTWIGGWLMPQRSSFFVLRLPHNWFMLCGDTGNMQDIDVAQRNYFLDVIEKYMDAESCVILAAHEPGWVLEAMERDEKPRQPELNRVVEELGTRLRLRLAGDIHHYSRHTPRDTASEAATLVVSGGGGAFLHGARNDDIISQGTKYVRACAFPDRNTFMNMATRLWGFRVVNWKFDLVVGFLCFVMLLSVLPLPLEHDTIGDASPAVVGKMRLAQLFSLWVGYTTEIMWHVVTRGVISLGPLLFFWGLFSSAGADRHAPLAWRLCYGGAWTFAVFLCCCGAMASVQVQLVYLLSYDLLHSSAGTWGSELEAQAVVLTAGFIEHAAKLVGGKHSALGRSGVAVYAAVRPLLPVRPLLVLLRCLDPFEALAFLSITVSGGRVAVFAAAASRVQVALYYVYVLFFYWVLVTPLVSVVIGTFLLFSVTTFDYMYDGTYSAFQMEEYKHFIRFRLDAATRELHAYVVAVQKPSKVYRLDRGYLWSLAGPGLEEHRPPHLKQHPSRWAPVQRDEQRKRSMTEILEHFTVYPHRVPQQRAKQTPMDP